MEGAIQATLWMLALWLTPPWQAPTQSPVPPAQPPAIAAEQNTGHFEEQRVAAVRVISESGEVIQENPAELAQQAGQTYHSDAVRESLRQLYRSGRYADVRAEAAAVEGGVRVDFVVQPNLYVNSVHVSGLREPPSEGQALAALQLGLGEPFRERTLRDAMERLQQTLREEGFHQARMEVERKETAATQQMDLLIRVTPGPRARVGQVSQQGLTSDEKGTDLLRRSKIKTGKQITALNLDRGADRVRKYLVGRGYLSARVNVRRGEYNAQDNTEAVALAIFPGPQIKIEVKGAKISARRLRALLPIYQEGAVDEDLLQEGRRNIRDYMESQGYFDSQVYYERSADGSAETQVITFTVERGPQRRLAGIEFAGNKYFSTDLLREGLHIQPAAFTSHGRFSRKLLEADTGAIQQMYIANGFRDAKVEPEQVEDYQGKKGDLFVRFRITEGEQALVSSLKLEGNKTLENDFLLSVIGSSEGQPFSDFNMSSDRDNVLALYYNEGFPEARFEPTAEAETPNRMRLTYKITEGPQIRVKKILLGGYEHTKERTIQREVKVKEGEPLREGDVVETQRRLYNLGIFNRVQIAPQNPAGTDTEKTVIVLVEEGKRYTIAYGGGVEVQRLGSATNPVGGDIRASPRIIFEISKANVLGRAHTLSFKMRASTLQGRALLSYSAPVFWSFPNLSFQLTGFADKSRDVRTFTSTKYEGSAQIAEKVTNLTTVLYRYVFRRVQVDASSLKINPLEVPLFSQPTRISGPGISWVRERRDDPADATAGSFNTADLIASARSLGSSASFVRAFLQNSTFYSFKVLRGTRKLVFARSTRIGIERELGDTLPPDQCASGLTTPAAICIPLPERFFAGGGNSLRGFALNQAGPRDALTGFPIGGQAMVLFNQELRFPMKLPYVHNPVGGVIFYDAGNVFQQLNHFTLALKPPAPVFSTVTPNLCVTNCTNEMRYFSHTIGFGIRYATPIGPVRLDLGYLLNAPQILVPDGLGGQKLSRLPRFHFFFNIGSLF